MSDMQCKAQSEFDWECAQREEQLRWIRNNLDWEIPTLPHYMSRHQLDKEDFRRI